VIEHHEQSRYDVDAATVLRDRLRSASDVELFDGPAPAGSHTGDRPARHDKDGDAQAISTRLAPGADKIEWKSVSGTGKYAGKQDSGWAQMIFAEGKVVVVKMGR
jgi:hypothetical protein